MSSICSLRQPMAEGVVDQFLRGFQAEFEEDAFFVGLHGALADVEFVTYLAGGHSLGTEPNHFDFAFGQLFGVAIRTGLQRMAKEGFDALL